MKALKAGLVILGLVFVTYGLLALLAPEVAAQVRGLTEKQLTEVERTFTARQNFEEMEIPDCDSDSFTCNAGNVGRICKETNTSGSDIYTKVRVCAATYDLGGGSVQYSTVGGPWSGGLPIAYWIDAPIYPTSDGTGGLGSASNKVAQVYANLVDAEELLPPACNADPPTGACTAGEFCLVTAAGKVTTYGCGTGTTWVTMSPATLPTGTTATTPFNLDGGGAIPRILPSNAPSVEYWTGGVSGQTNNTYDLGRDYLRWKTLYAVDVDALDDVTMDDDLVVGDDATIADILNLTEDDSDNWAIDAGPDGLRQQNTTDSEPIDTLVTRSEAAAQRYNQAYVAITFDDGNDEMYDDYRAILNARNVRATFCINTNTIGNAGKLTWAEVNTMIADGHEFADHSVDHTHVESTDSGTVTAEMEEAIDDFATNANGYRPVTYCYPYGENGNTTDGVPMPVIASLWYQFGRSNTNHVDLYPHRDPMNMGAWFGPATGGAGSGNTAAIDYYESVGRYCGANNDRACVAVFGIHGNGGLNIHHDDLGTVIDTLKAEGVRFVTLAEAASMIGGATTRRNLIANSAGIDSQKTGIDRPLYWAVTDSTKADASSVYTWHEDGCVTVTDDDLGANAIAFKPTVEQFYDYEYPIYDPNIDTPYYTTIKSAVLLDPNLTDDGLIQFYYPQAVTIDRVACSTDTGTVTIQLDERAEATPNTGGTDVMTSQLVCDNDTQTTTAFDNAGIAARVPLSMDVDAVASTPGVLRLHVEAHPTLPNGFRRTRVYFAVDMNITSTLSGGGGARYRIQVCADSDGSSCPDSGTTYTATGRRVLYAPSITPLTDDTSPLQAWIQIYTVNSGTVKFCNPVIGFEYADNVPGDT